MEETTAKPKSKKRSAQEESQKPLHVVAVGQLAAGIFLRQAPSGYAYHAYSVKRTYRSLSTGSQIQSTDFFADNLTDLIAVVTQASRWIAEETEKARHKLRDAA